LDIGDLFQFFVQCFDEPDMFSYPYLFPFTGRSYFFLLFCEVCRHNVSITFISCNIFISGEVNNGCIKEGMDLFKQSVVLDEENVGAQLEFFFISAI
jgi:hypothetical protein